MCTLFYTSLVQQFESRCSPVTEHAKRFNRLELRNASISAVLRVVEYLAVVCVKLMKFQAESPTVPRMGLHKLSRAPQPLQRIGSYTKGGGFPIGFRGVYNAPIGTTIRVASSRDEGQTFQDRRTPSLSSCAWIEDMSMVPRAARCGGVC